jgi:uncharacterized integral membrane protein
MQNVLLQGYFWNVLLAVVASAAGLVAIVVSILRWNRKNTSMLAFGATSLLYGLRLLVEAQLSQYGATAPPQTLLFLTALITYVIGVPLSAFFLDLFGPGWKNSMLWLLRAAIFFAFAGILSDVVLATPFSLESLNNTLVVIWAGVVLGNALWPGLQRTRELRVVLMGFLLLLVLAVNENLVSLGLLPWEWQGEPLGFLAVLLALGYVAGHRYFTNESQLLTIQREMEIARQIQSSILPRCLPAIHGLDIAARYVPMASVAGDFYDLLMEDERRLCILIADVSGHGVGAALIASMLKVAFASQHHVLSDPALVLAGINQALSGNLENNFVTAGCLFLDPDADTIRYAGAGHPPLILYRRTEHKFYELGNNGLLLGPFPDAEYQSKTMQIEAGDRLILYTDGIIETSNPSGSFFGEGFFKTFIEAHAHVSAENFADKLLQHLDEWSGKPSGDSLDDDLTLIVVDKS